MIDKQVEHAQPQVRIPFVSACLHFMSMPVLVYLRSGFGYAYLRPRSIFLAFSWAFVLFTLFSLIEFGAWRSNKLLCAFGLGAIALYLLHFIVSFVSELRRTATNDYSSGTPHLLRFLPKAQRRRIHSQWVLWVEPGLVLVAAIAVRFLFDATNLSTWLLLIVPSLWFKEALNFWFQLRQRKRHRDSMEDAEDAFDGSHAQTEVAPPTASRKDKIRRKRAR